MDNIVGLVIPFIAIIFFIGMTENIVEFLQKLIRKFLNEIVLFLIVSAMGTGIAYLGDFRFFSYLDVNFQPPIIAYLMTGIVIGAGSPFMDKKFDIINKIPLVISGTRISISSSHTEKTDTEKPTI